MSYTPGACGNELHISLLGDHQCYCVVCLRRLEEPRSGSSTDSRRRRTTHPSLLRRADENSRCKTGHHWRAPVGPEPKFRVRDPNGYHVCFYFLVNDTSEDAISGGSEETSAGVRRIRRAPVVQDCRLGVFTVLNNSYPHHRCTSGVLIRQSL